MERAPDTVYVLALSYGKDSLACLGAVELLGWPLDLIVHTEVWATETVPAELPPMVEFKDRADKIIKERWGFEVQRAVARKEDGSVLTFEEVFYRKFVRGKNAGRIYGWPQIWGNWCNQLLKRPIGRSDIGSLNVSPDARIVQYLGIAADETERVERHDVPGKMMPLVEVGWTEADARRWCERNGLLSPIYTDTARGGCWYCYYQSIDQLRQGLAGDVSH
jgi:hypothetical protein